MTTHTQIAHRWAQMHSKLSLRGHAMFADGFSIFSYGRHFEIARWTPTLASERARMTQGVPAMCVLLTSEKRSISTSKHTTYVWRAIPSRAWVFALPSSLWGDHKASLAYFETQALDALGRASRARVNAAWYTQQAETLLTSAERYALAFAVKWTRADMTALQARAAKRVAAQAAEARKAAKHRAEAEAARRAREANDFAAWRAGEGQFVPASWRCAPDGSAYLRLHEDELQTSQGASVPLAHAVKAFRFVKLIRERGEGWTANGRSVRVGHFTVDSIDARGNMRAGCHLLTWSEIDRAAALAGVRDAAPADTSEPTLAA